MSSIAENIAILRKKVASACISAGRGEGSVRLIAVSKTFPAARIQMAAAAGETDFGENYLREAESKVSALSDLRLNWHFIGHLQSNKARLAARIFDWIHTVDGIPLARRLSAARVGMSPLNICLQVNIDGELSKSGVAPEDVSALAEEVSQLPNLKVRGLMTIPSQSHTDKRAPYHELSALQAKIALPLDTLSMGMSDDYEEAIAEGATHIRIGRAIFGERT